MGKGYNTLTEVTEDYINIVSNLTPQQIERMDEINREDDEKNMLPKGLKLELPEDLLGKQR